MKKSKLLSLLSTFSAEEIKKFEKFITSPYFNNNRNFIPVYKILKKYYPSFEDPELSEENIFKKLYPEKTFDKKSAVSVRVILSQLTSLAEKFLTYEFMEDFSKTFISRFLSYSFSRRGMDKECIKEALNNQNLLLKTQLDPALIDSLITINSHIFSSYLGMNKQHLCGDVNNNMSLYCISSMFSQFSKLINNNRGLERRYNLKIKSMRSVEKIIENFDVDEFENDFPDDETGIKKYAVLNYYICKSFLDKYDDDSLFKAINLFKEIHLRIDAYSIFTRLHNICRTRAYNMDYIKYAEIDHKLSKFAWENKYYLDSGKYLRAVAYESIFEFKVALLNPANLKIFINKYIPEIHSESRVEMLNNSLEWVYFKESKFEKALELLSKIRLVDNSFKESIYKLKIVLLTELKFFEEVFLTIDAYEHYLNNNKNVSDDVKTNGKCFNSTVKLIIKYLTNSSSGINFELTSAIEKNKNSVFGIWFNEKLSLIKTSF